MYSKIALSAELRLEIEPLINHERYPKSISSQGDGDIFFALFTGREYSFLRYSPTSRWLQLSRFHCLSEQELLSVLNGEDSRQRGFCIEAGDPFIVFLIDDISRVNELIVTLKSLGVARPVLYRQGSEQAAYLFLFVASLDLEKIRPGIESWLMRSGFFPGARMAEPGHILPVPLQPGFSWLGEQGQIVVQRNEIALDAALSMFDSDMHRGAVSIEVLLDAFGSADSDAAAKAAENTEDSPDVDRDEISGEIPGEFSADFTADFTADLTADLTADFTAESLMDFSPIVEEIIKESEQALNNAILLLESSNALLFDSTGQNSEVSEPENFENILEFAPDAPVAIAEQRESFSPEPLSPRSLLERKNKRPSGKTKRRDRKRNLSSAKPGLVEVKEPTSRKSEISSLESTDSMEVIPLSSKNNPRRKTSETSPLADSAGDKSIMRKKSTGSDKKQRLDEEGFIQLPLPFTDIDSPIPPTV